MKPPFLLLFFSFFLFIGKIYAQVSYLKHSEIAFKFSDSEQTVRYLDSIILNDSNRISIDTIAFFYHKIGQKKHSSGDLLSAVFYTRKAVKAREHMKAQGKNVTEELSNSYANVGSFYRILSETTFLPVYRDSTIFFFKKIISLGSVPENAAYSLACYELGSAYFDFQDFNRSQQYFDSGIEYCLTQQEFSPKNSFRLAKLYYGAEDTYRHTNRISPPERLVQIQASIDTLKSYHKYNLVALAYSKKAEILKETKQSKEAIEAYKQAIYWNKELLAAKYKGKTDEWLRRLTFAWNNFGNFYLGNGLYAEAENCFAKSLHLKEQRYGEGLHPEKSAYYINMGELLLKQGKTAQATQYLHTAIAHLVPDFRSENLGVQPNKKQMELCPYKANLLYTLEQKSVAMRELERQGLKSDGAFQALQCLRSADALTDIMRREQVETESKLFWRKKTRGLYEKALNLAYEKQDAEQAFYFFEKSKAVLLSDALTAAGARSYLPDSLVAREQNLLRSLVAARENFLKDKKNYDAYFLAERSYEEHLQQAEAQFPRFYQARYASEVPDFKATQKQITGIANTQFVHFFLGQNDIFSLRFNGEDYTLLRKSYSPETNTLLQEFLGKFQSAYTIENQPEAYKATATKLYELLLRDLFAGAPLPENLVLFPDDRLNLLPFSALIDFQDNRFLLEKTNIRYAYSFDILNKKKQEKGPALSALGIAPFSNSGNENSLAFSSQELENLSHICKGEYAYGEQATKEFFLQKSKDHQILHLSTHALEKGENDNPQILFADANLSLPELYAADFPHNLVVLSACETGLGEVKTGEGIQSLTRGFTYAGAQSIISSLWKVNDASTEQILSAFYKNLSTGMSKSAALHDAKKTFLQEAPPELKSPYYWAGLTFTGQDGKVNLESNRTGISSLLLILGSVGLLIFFGFLLRKKL